MPLTLDGTPITTNTLNSTAITSETLDGTKVYPSKTENPTIVTKLNVGSNFRLAVTNNDTESVTISYTVESPGNFPGTYTNSTTVAGGASTGTITIAHSLVGGSVTFVMVTAKAANKDISDTVSSSVYTVA